MKYCKFCGAECKDDATFCPECGKQIDGGEPAAKKPNGSALTSRSILSVVLLSVITCGIYTIYWYYVTAEDLNAAEPKEPLMNYILAWLLGFVTCGIFTIYWQYKFYKKLDDVTGDSNYLLNLLLSIFLTPIVGIAIGQSSINNCLERNR